MARPIDADRWFDPASSRGSYGVDDRAAQHVQGRTSTSPPTPPTGSADGAARASGETTVGHALAAIAEERDSQQALAALINAVLAHVDIADAGRITAVDIQHLQIDSHCHVRGPQLVTELPVFMRAMRECLGSVSLSPTLARIVNSRLPTDATSVANSLAQIASREALGSAIAGMTDVPQRPWVSNSESSTATKRAIILDEDDIDDGSQDTRFRRSAPIFALIVLGVAFLGSLALNFARDSRVAESVTRDEPSAAAAPLTEPSSYPLATTGAGARGAISIPTEPSVSDSDIQTMIEGLDRRRRAALAEPSTAALATFNAPESSAMTADAALVDQLRNLDARIEGGGSTVLLTRKVTADSEHIIAEVVDTRDAYRVVANKSGAILATQPRRGRQTWRVTVVHHDGRWLLSEAVTAQ